MRPRIGRLAPWCALPFSCWASLAMAQHTAFFYGPRLPHELLAVYERIVVEPAHGFDPALHAAQGTELAAYLSVNELADSNPQRSQLDPAWVAGRNPDWQSSIVDLSAPAFREFFLRVRFEPLWQQGYRSFFLDTLDSYMRLPEAARQQQRAGLVTLLRAMHERHPDARFLLNRGFEVLEEVHHFAHGLVAESLFDGWDAARGRYVRVGAADREWLLAELKRARARFKLPVYVIDYRPPHERDAALQTAARIAALGFEPWVTDALLQSIGTSTAQVVPRRVLLLTNTDGAQDDMHDAVRYLAPWLEYLGHVPERHDVRVTLPDAVPGSVRAVVIWLQGAQLAPGYAAFIARQRELGVPLVFFGHPGVALADPAARALGFEEEPALAGRAASRAELLRHGAVAQGETPAEPNLLELVPVRVSGESVVSHLSLGLGERQVQLVATAAWGGIASSHFMVPRGLHGERAWAIDPALFLERALGSHELPVPDLTTEHGGRIALFVIRAAGLGERSRHAGRPQVLRLLEQLLARERVPHVVDTVRSEHNAVSDSDLAAARRLQSKHLSWSSPRPSTVKLTLHDSISRLEPLSSQLRAEAGPALPLGGDYGYIPEGIHESYPFRALLQTLQRSDSPRRLTPIVLDYHAASLASPGGFETISSLYRSITAFQIRALSFPEYVTRLHAFVRQVLTRHSDGSIGIHGGGELLTLRVPAALGAIDLRRSEGIACVRALPQGKYVSFLPSGRRRIAFAAGAERPPHLSYASGAIESLASEAAGDGTLLRIGVKDEGALTLAVQATAEGDRCVLQDGARSSAATADRQGQVWFEVQGRRDRVVEIRCQTGAGRGP